MPRDYHSVTLYRLPDMIPTCLAYTYICRVTMIAQQDTFHSGESFSLLNRHFLLHPADKSSSYVLLPF